MATQKDAAEHLDMTHRRIQMLFANGTLPSSKGRGGVNIDACRVAYIRYLRGIASGQVKSTSPIEDAGVDIDGGACYEDLIEREKYRKIKRENDEAEGRLAPVDLLTAALAKAASSVVATLESLPLLIKRQYPEVTADQTLLVKKAIAECRNNIADISIESDD